MVVININAVTNLDNQKIYFIFKKDNQSKKPLKFIVTIAHENSRSALIYALGILSNTDTRFKNVSKESLNVILNKSISQEEFKADFFGDYYYSVLLDLVLTTKPKHLIFQYLQALYLSGNKHLSDKAKTFLPLSFSLNRNPSLKILEYIQNNIGRVPVLSNKSIHSFLNFQCQFNDDIWCEYNEDHVLVFQKYNSQILRINLFTTKMIQSEL